ncbi:LysR family transcriptional regulator [Pseudochelatococcus sp. B33]
MNLDALLSFVQVTETGSFSLAAQRLHVTQSTISNRIQALEDDLGCVLFLRGRGGASLTAEGQKLRADAGELISLWNAARRRVALPPGLSESFRLGTPTTFDNDMSTRLVIWLRQALPDTALHIEAGSSGFLLDAVASRSLDAAIMFLPAHRPGLVIEELYQEELVLVASVRMRGEWRDNFIDVTWGEEFAREFSRAFPSFPAPSLSVGLGVLGAQYLTALNGAAYLTRAQARSLTAMREARLVPDVPTFRRLVYLAHARKSRNPELLTQALDGIRQIARRTDPAAAATNPL